MSNNPPSSAYSDGYSAITFAMFRHGVLRNDHHRGLTIIPDRQAYDDFLAGVKASLKVLAEQETEP